MKIEEYIKLRKKRDNFDETNRNNREENIHKLIDYVFDYYKLLDENQVSKKNQIKNLKRNVNYQYEIDPYSEAVQRWLIKIFTEYNIKINQQISKFLDNVDFFLLISDMEDWNKLSYDLYTKMTDRYKILSDYPFELTEFAKEYYRICNKTCGLSMSRYRLARKSQVFIKEIHGNYGINLVAWSKSYLTCFYSNITLWPWSHRILLDVNGRKSYRYNINATRNTFGIGDVLEKLSVSNNVPNQLKKNKKMLVELLREISRVDQNAEEKIVIK